MSTTSEIARIAALVGDPTRANMLLALMDGRAHSAGELAYAAHVTPQTASAHLGKLGEAGLVAVHDQGRHRYFRLASAQIAAMLESIGALAGMSPPRRRRSSLRDEGMRTARTCYDHLAGRLGVALAEALAAHGHLVLGEEGGEVTPEGREFLASFGIDLAAAMTGRRCFCRPCLDWSERRLHIGGALGAALAERAFALRWIERVRDSRAVVLTGDGRTGFRDLFAISPEAIGGCS